MVRLEAVITFGTMFHRKPDKLEVRPLVVHLEEILEVIKQYTLSNCN